MRGEHNQKDIRLIETLAGELIPHQKRIIHARRIGDDRRPGIVVGFHKQMRDLRDRRIAPGRIIIRNLLGPCARANITLQQLARQQIVVVLFAEQFDVGWPQPLGGMLAHFFGLSAQNFRVKAGQKLFRRFTQVGITIDDPVP